MDVTQSLIFITSYYSTLSYSWSYFQINDAYLKAAFFRKTMLVVTYAEILHNSFIPKTYEKFKSVSFYLSSKNENLETCIPVWFEQLRELKQI